MDTSFLALPISQVVEVTRPLPMTRLPDAPSWVSGVCVLRGSVTPVVDARRLLTGRAANDTPNPSERWVALRVAERRAALAVDAVLRTYTLSDEQRDLPPLLASCPVVSELAALDSKLLMVLQGAHLLSKDVLSTLEGYAPGR